MNADGWDKLDDLFHAALARGPAERPGFLARACGDDAALRRELEEMVAAHEGDTRLGIEDRFVSDGAGQDPLLGRTFGAYRLLSLLGRGGMGDVYLAERDDDQYERRVAFKLIRAGFGGGASTERFLRERRILAQLEHPNVAMLLDGGTTDDGRPYLVMQYVDGEPITDWCRRRNATLRERLELFRVVCDTVQAAHNNLVVHRDLKPANILVTAEGQVKLLDFGIAKLLDDPEPGLTVALDRLLTPEHAAPEQVTGRAVTTATDVYALGVLLYEMLTGERPLAVDRSSAGAIERAICETTPAPPSTRSGGGRALRGELDNIVLTALRKEPDRRYPSARELGEDVGNHLAGRPVKAQGDSLGYRARKFLGRHRWAAAGVAAFLLTVAWSLGAVTRQSQRAAAERDRALAEQARADAVVAVLSDLLVESNPRTAGRDGAIRRDDFIALLGEAVDGLGDQPDVQVRLRELLAGVHLAHSRFELALADMEQVVAYHERAGSDPLTLARLRHDRAIAVHNARGPEAAEPLFRASLARHRELLGDGHPDVGIAAQELAGVLIESAPDEAAALMDEAFAIAQRTAGADSVGMAGFYNRLGALALAAGDARTAQARFARSLELLEPALGESHPHVLTVSHNLAVTLQRREEWPRAEAMHRRIIELQSRAVGPRTFGVARSWDSLGIVLAFQGRRAEALEAFAQSLGIFREVMGDSDALVSAGLRNAGVVTLVDGRAREALALFDEMSAIDAALAAAGAEPDPLEVAFRRAWRAFALYAAGDRQAALDEFDAVTTDLPAEAPVGRLRLLADVNQIRATMLLAEGRPAEAEAPARLAASQRETAQADPQPLLAAHRCLVAAAVAGQGRTDEARALLAAHRDMALQWGLLHPLQRAIIGRAAAEAGLE